jgi:hypothetical protein
MPYAQFITDERIALQAMTAMRLPGGYIAVIIGKHPGGIYRE